MWNLKFKVKNVDSIYTTLTQKLAVKDYFYPVDKYKNKKSVLILGIHVLEGSQTEINKFASAIKQNHKVKQFEKNGNRLMFLISEEEKFYELLYNPELYLPTPVTIESGFEFWNVAAWNRKILEDLLREFEKWKSKLQEFELLSLRQENLEEIYFPQIYPKLPEKQHRAFEIAINNDYYTFPRKKNLDDLARLMNVKTQTYHEHLRKAEAKLLPFFGRNFKK